MKVDIKVVKRIALIMLIVWSIFTTICCVVLISIRGEMEAEYAELEAKYNGLKKESESADIPETESTSGQLDPPFTDGTGGPNAPHVHTEVIDSAVFPTCANTGLTEGKHCAVCNEIIVGQRTIPATGHNYTLVVEDPTTTPFVILTHICSACGDSYNEAVVPTDLTITKSNRAMVGYTGKYGEKLVIPALFNENGTWYRVSSIGAAAFKECTNLSSITIPNSVDSIGDYAFYWCISMTSITLPDSVKSIGEWAFSSTALTNITIPYGVMSIGDLAFAFCDNLKTITIPDGVTRVSTQLFSNCTNLSSITIPNSVDSIGSFAFHWCESLSSITIPNSVKSIDSFAFENCTSLTNISFDGTVAQWNAISLGKDWIKNVPANKVICSNGIVALN